MKLRKKVTSTILAVLLLFTTVLPVFASESTFRYEQIANEYMSALLAGDAITAYDMIAPYRVDNGKGDILDLISNVADFESIMEESTVCGYKITDVKQTENGAIVSVVANQTDGLYKSDLVINNTSGKYLIDLAKSEITSLNRTSNEVILQATLPDANDTTIISRARRRYSLDDYSFSYLFGSIKGIDTFNVYNGNEISIDGSQYDDMWPNRQYKIKVQYQIRAPKTLGTTTLVSFSVQGNGNVSGSGRVSSNNSNCYIYISNITGNDSVRVQGEGEINS